MPYANNPDDDIKSYYEDDEGDGPCVLFYAGYSDSIADSRATALAKGLEGNCRLVYADHRGHGLSDKPHDFAAYDLRRRVGDVVAVIDALEVDRVHFAGSSWGARLGFAVGENASNRVASLILGGNQPYEWDFASPLIQVAEAAVAVLETEGMAGFLRVGESLLGERFPEPARSGIEQNDPLALKAAWDSIYHEGEISPDLTRWTMSCLIYAGAEDPMRENALRASQEIPNATFIEIPGATHMSLAGSEDPIVFAASALIAATN